MEPFRSHPGSQTAIFLAGCILSCLLQLVSAQENLTVVSQPQYPIEGQAVFLYAKNLREGFQFCEWTEPSGSTTGFGTPQKVVINGTHLAELHPNCTFTIRNPKPSSQGRYTVQVTYPPAKQSAAKGSETFIGSVYLTVCDGEQIHININPPRPLVGQSVTLTPNDIPGKDYRCQWKYITKSGEEKDPRQGSKDQQNQGSIPPCSLHLTKLTQADSGNYSLLVEPPSDQNPGKGKNREQIKCYRSQTELKVANIDGSSDPIKNSAGMIAGALLGSLTWTSILTLVPLLFGILSPSFPKC